MKRVVYYISDVGWGHAARSSVLISELAADPGGVEVVVRNLSALTLLRTLLSRPLEEGRVVLAPPDEAQDPLWPGLYPFSRAEVKRALLSWLGGYGRRVREEVSFLRRMAPDLVVSDIVPQAFEAAHSLGIPCVAVTNINWWDEYTHILGDVPSLEVVRNAYSLALWCFLLPFESNNTPFRLKERVPLVARSFCPERVREIRRALRARHRPEIVALVGTGAHYKPDENVVRAMEEASSRAKILWLVPETFPDVDGLLLERVAPADFTDALAASDFAVVKFGYSTVAEAVLARVPMLLLYRPEVLEDCLATEELVSSRWALRVPMGAGFGIPLEELFSLERSPLSKRMENRGAEAVLKRLRERYL